MARSLQFIGGTGTVTGSKYLITTKNNRILVDCGLFQGLKVLRERNRKPLPLSPRSISHVVLTHAHLDHSGYVPLLVKKGYSGEILSTRATKALCGILLPDSGRLQEEDAHYANKHQFTKHEPALPLYTEKDARHCLKYFRTVEYHQSIKLSKNISFEYFRAGHIPGSCIVKFNLGGETVVFSGDLGRPINNLLPQPDRVTDADVLVLESTYGDRVHDREDPEVLLERLINKTVQRKGRILIPAFAVGRTQEILHFVIRLKKQNRIPQIPIYVDSPMATEATRVFLSFSEENRLTAEEAADMRAHARFVDTTEESRALNDSRESAIIISASGMATGGRVLHHLEHMADVPENMVIFAGFQAAGTRGADMVAGARQIKVHGRMISVRAEIQCLDVLSAHADADEIMQWLGGFRKPPRHTFITHGEPQSSEALRKRIQSELGWSASVPDYLETVSLDRL